MTYSSGLLISASEFSARRFVRINSVQVRKKLNRRAFSIRKLLSIWSLRFCQRNTLRTLEDWQLADIGKTRAEAVSESNKVFWKA